MDTGANPSASPARCAPPSSRESIGRASASNRKTNWPRATGSAGRRCARRFPRSSAGVPARRAWPGHLRRRAQPPRQPDHRRGHHLLPTISFPASFRASTRNWPNTATAFCSKARATPPPRGALSGGTGGKGDRRPHRRAEQSQIFCRHAQLYERFDARGVPYVFIQGCFETMRDRPHVLLDDAGGAYLATKHLLSLGHRRIAGIFKADDTQGVERHRGYVRALQEAGVLYDPDIVLWYHTEDRTVAPAAGAAVLSRRGQDGRRGLLQRRDRRGRRPRSGGRGPARAGGYFRRRVRQFPSCRELQNGLTTVSHPTRNWAAPRRGCCWPSLRRTGGNVGHSSAGADCARLHRAAAQIRNFCKFPLFAKKQLVRQGVQVVCLFQRKGNEFFTTTKQEECCSCCKQRTSSGF